MDPGQTLIIAESILREEPESERDLWHVFLCLSDYWEWRATGGYEPPFGDSRAREARRKLRAGGF